MAPRGKRGASPSSTDTHESKKSKPAYRTSYYNSDLQDNLIETVDGVPPRLEPLIRKVRQPFEVGKEGVKTLVDLQRGVRAFSRQHTRLMDNGANENTYEIILHSVLLLDSLNVDKALQAMREELESPEMRFLHTCAANAFRDQHYGPFLRSNVTMDAKPDTVVALLYKRVSDVVRSVLDGDDVIASEILEKIRNKCELSDAGMYLSSFIGEFKSKQPIANTIHQLRRACAAALEAGRPWIGDDNVVFGLAADLGSAYVYIAWSEDPLSGKASRRYKLSRVAGMSLGEPEHVERLQHMLLRIHLWAAHERRMKIEDDLRASVTKELEERAKRRDVVSVILKILL
ncbi:hypothetical protein F4818DRAFT_55035 [Hypoxylon cercidicola]|nr:hypothetical protein F4818DRAFT_55035 [Hypoxylon cercidicola]